MATTEKMERSSESRGDGQQQGFSPEEEEKIQAAARPSTTRDAFDSSAVDKKILHAEYDAKTGTVTVLQQQQEAAPDQAQQQSTTFLRVVDDDSATNNNNEAAALAAASILQEEPNFERLKRRRVAAQIAGGVAGGVTGFIFLGPLGAVFCSFAGNKIVKLVGKQNEHRIKKRYERRKLAKEQEEDAAAAAADETLNNKPLPAIV